jgi:hypothetical protein
LVRERPDLRFFSYHALSERNAWRLPPCEELPQRIADLVEHDRRRYPDKPAMPIQEAYIDGGGPAGLFPYLQGIYPNAYPEIDACLFNGLRLDVSAVETCKTFDANRCIPIVIAKLSLPAPSAP